MKKLFSLVAVLTAITIIIASFKSADAPPRLYPELEAYFKSVETKEFSKEHLDALASIKNDISTSHMHYEDWNLIFYCNENTFRSQASQVFAQTLCYAKKHKKIKVFSAGLTSGEINPKLIDYLSKIGYKVAKDEKEGRFKYNVKFSEQADPLVLYSKTTSDKSLPTKDVTSVIVCDTKAEPDCATLKTESTLPLNLAFPKVLATDENDKVETTLKGIAAEMVYVTKK